MPENPTIMACLNCGKPLKGRSDKKYCDDACRNNHNNQLKAPGTNYTRHINKALSRNRHILKELLKEDKPVKILKEKLLKLGFQFKYLTHLHTTKKGSTYRFCYEYGYLPLEHDWFLIVKEKEAL